MSEIYLRVRLNNKLHSIILNDYRIGGCKWNDIEHGECIEYPVNKEDIAIALGIDKTIADLQSQLDQAKNEIIKYKILLNDMETENSHLETMLNQANEKIMWLNAEIDTLKSEKENLMRTLEEAEEKLQELRGGDFSGE